MPEEDKTRSVTETKKTSVCNNPSPILAGSNGDCLRQHKALRGILRMPVMQVLLLDEITVDLDVLGRADLMHFLKVRTYFNGY